MLSEDKPCIPEARPMPWLRGSFMDAYATFWWHWGEKRGPFWAHLVLMVAFNSLVGLFISLVSAAFTGHGIWESFRDSFPFAQWIGFTIRGIMVLCQRIIGSEKLRGMGTLGRVFYYGGLSLAGVYLGFSMALFTRTGTLSSVWATFRDESFVGSVGLSLVMTTVMYQVISSKIKAAQAIAEIERERARTMAAEKQASEAQLKMLQAQIEPHFLFNTLANVVGLIDPQPQDARRMLENFIHYLRGSLNATRQAETTLGAELELITSYLAILKVRMADRLTFDVDLPADLKMFAIAPMLIQPIVENAIEHGLEPKVNGGSVSIKVTRTHDQLCIAIADTGLGFQSETSGGIGLTNVRERLRMLYGPAGRLEIRENPPQGTCVVLFFPLAA